VTRPTTVLVIATDEARAAGIEAKLRGQSEWRPVVGRSPHLIRLVEQHRPDVVVLAEEPPRLARALEALRDHPARPPIMVLLTDPRGAWTRERRRAGVHAVMPRDATAEELTAALRALRSGLVVLHPEALSVAPAASSLDTVGDRALTSREREIVEMMAEGLGNRVIARRLAISRHTVKFHVASILAKLRARSRTEAVVTAVRRGLLSV
jgi:NarL family two-component system response regulator YdfI